MPVLEGRVAVVTGGSRGIGRATAAALANQGARVVIAGTSAAVDETASSLGPTVLGVRADVTREDDVSRLFAATTAAWGGLDILVNNAGVGVFSPVESTLLADWRRVIDTNLTGVFLCSRQAVPLLRQRGGGWIVNVSSLASTNPFAEGATYCASKAGLNAFTDSLMQEVRHDGIRVGCILPGSVATDFMGRSAATHTVSQGAAWKLTPEDIAQAILDMVVHTSRSLPSRVEIRPAQPPRRG